MSRSDSHVAAPSNEVSDASNVLVLSPAMELADGEGCASVVSAGDLDGSNFLVASLTGTPDERLDALRSRLGPFEPAALGFVSAGDQARSAAVAASSGGMDLPVGEPSISVEMVNSPADLTGLGIRISSILSEWEGSGNQVVACFDSLTTLLQYAEVRQVFRFLHVLTGRFDVVGARAHYHLDPGAHDEKDLNTLKALFDAVASYDDGSWDVRTR